GLLTGLAPSISRVQSSGLSWENTAQAQDFSDQEVTDYARAVLAMEPRRKEAYEEIKGISGGSVPPVVCSETRGINDLNRNIRTIAVNYCDQAKKIIESHNLTVARFNAITLAQKGNPAIKARIQAELVRLQQAGQ
ncbi:MAG: DUF4168 domain-containing protein, partial [Microcoleaceae cyanobacterium]